MTGRLMIDHDTLRSLVAAIKDASWTWRPDAVGALCRRMGWKLVEDLDERGGFADAGWDLGGDDVAMAFRDGYVDDITMRITRIVREPADRDRFLDGVFADAVAVVTSVLGMPTARDLTEPATARWRMAGSTVVVGRYRSSVKLTWAGNRFHDRSGARSWEQLSDDVAARVPRLAEGDVIVLGSGRRYTQLMQRRNGLTVEAVSNSGLPPEQQLSAEQEDRLREKGWHPPNRPLRLNWWYDVDQWPLHGRDAARIAELMVSTLRDVYDVPAPDAVEETSFNALGLYPTTARKSE